MLWRAFLIAGLALVSIEGSAPAAAQSTKVTSAQIVRVTSPVGGTEYPSDGAYSRTYDHNGAYFEVAVNEIGYASSRSATFVGKLPSSALVSSTAICTNSATPPACRSGQTVIGYQSIWRFNAQAITGASNPIGQFSTSISGNGGSASDSIQIR